MKILLKMSLLLFLVSTCLFAQTEDNKQFKIIALDLDLELPLEGVRILNKESGKSVYTDTNGTAFFEVPYDAGRIVIYAELPGYSTRRILVKDFSDDILIKMMIEGVLEGEELVVEEKAIGKTDEKVGVSTLIEKDVIQSAGKIGIIEDVMSAVSILPGVTYNGGFGSYLSVRGSDPEGLTAIMDGSVVKYPYHWGGAYSIFNPNIVESVKFSAGVFSPRYGQATSGILEVTTVDPTDGFRYSIVSSMSTYEFFLQAPIGSNEHAGLFFGTRLTNYDIVFQLARSQMEEAGTTFSRIPYIYDGYMKFFFRPSDVFEWYINGFWGNDGIGMENYDPDIDTAEEISNNYDFTWKNSDFFINSGVKILSGDRLFIHLLGGYEYWLARVDGNLNDYGNQAYSDEFIDQYSPGSDSYFIDTESSFINDIIRRSVQFRGDTDYIANDKLVWQNGIGASVDDTEFDVTGTYYAIDYTASGPVYRKKIYDTDASTSKKIYNSFTYSNFQWDIIEDELSMDIGCRLDHSYFCGEDYSINTYPVLGPRFNLRYTRKNPDNFFQENTWSMGLGLFSKTPFETVSLNRGMGLDDFDIAVPKTIMTILGWETRMPLGYRFKIEAYYKYIYDRFYFNSLYNETDGEEKFLFHNDGIGNVIGFDLILDRRTSRYFDGMLSYSFNYARYKDPEDDNIDNTEVVRDRWYYPYFHRFHTLNLLMNIKPYPWMTFTTKAGFATGVPREKYGEKEMFSANIENIDGSTSLAELYTRETFYSDTLRTWISLPLDFKLSFHNYYKHSRHQWEVYVAVEDILSSLLRKIGPENNITTDNYTGEETKEPSSDFSFTMITIGSKISY